MKLLKGTDLFDLVEKLQAIMKIIFLEETGFHRDEIVKIITTNNSFSSFIDREK